MKKTTVRLLVLAASAVVLAVIAAVVFAEVALHVPHVDPLSPRELQTAFPNLRLETVSLEARDHVHMEAWWIPSKNPAGKCVTVLHGIGDSRNGSVGFAPLFAAEDYSVLLPDSRGHGASGGRVVTYGIREKWDAIDWFEWARGRGCRQLYGLGESLGGAVLILAAAEYPNIQAIAAECSYADFAQIAHYRVQRITGFRAASLLVSPALLYTRLRYRENLLDASPIRQISRVKAPILLIHGMADVETPPAHSQALFARTSKGKLWLVPKATHANAYAASPVEFRQRVLHWFAENGAVN